MSRLTYTLVADGVTDKSLLPVLRWSLRHVGVTIPTQPKWADLSNLHRQPRGLTDKIRVSLELYPCELLFVHRDAEAEPRNRRVQEIQHALDENLRAGLMLPCAVFVVPVRMTEAWLLISEEAIREAAGNPNGTAPIDLPIRNRLENLPDPKQIMHVLLRHASGLRGRRLRKFDVKHAARRVSDLIRDFTPLTELQAFQSFVGELRDVARRNAWS